MKPGELIKLKVKNIGSRGVELVGSDGEEIFMPRTQYDEEPKLNQKLWVGIYLDQRNHLKATTKLSKVVLPQEEPAHHLQRGEEVTGRVYRIADFGTFIVTEGNHIGLIPKVDLPVQLQVGDLVAGRVTYVREDGRFNLSLRPIKEVARITDSEKIMQYLRGHEGAMPYGDNSPAEVIKEKFNLSKSAFKRALGKLLKDDLIYMENGWTYLTEKS